MSKFAPMTSNLLVRKGAAEPTVVAASDKSAMFWPRPQYSAAREAVEPPPIVAPPREAFPSPKAVASEAPPETQKLASEHHPERHKKITVALSDHEHEALGIAAVKLGVTRNHLVRDALDALLESLEKEYGGKCKCIADGSLQEVCCQAKSSN
jgi:hypothetical protein